MRLNSAGAKAAKNSADPKLDKTPATKLPRTNASRVSVKLNSKDGKAPAITGYFATVKLKLPWVLCVSTERTCHVTP